MNKLGPPSLIAAVVCAVTAPPALAQPATHQITYTITTAHPVSADIYFREVDPPTWADYSHNPYRFSPKVTVEVGPDRPWVLNTTLLEPRSMGDGVGDQRDVAAESGVPMRVIRRRRGGID